MALETDKPMPAVESGAREVYSKPPLTFGEKMGFSLGGAQQSFGYIPKSIILQVYNVLLCVNPMLLGPAVLINRLTEAMIEPWIGHHVDKRTNSGRKCKPLIWLGGIGSAILMPVIFLAPPGWGEYWKLAFLLVTTTVFVFAFSTFTVSLNAMLVARTGQGSDRNSLAAWFTMGAILGGTLGNWALPLIMWLKKVMSGGIQMPLLLGTGALAVFMLICTIVLQKLSREQPRIIVQAEETPHKTSSYGDMFRALKVKPFRILVIVSCVAVFGGAIVSQFSFYLKSYYMFGGDTMRGATWAAMAGMTWSISALACIPIFRYIAERCGKRNAIFIALSFGIAGEMAKWFIHQPGVPPGFLLLVAFMLAPYNSIGMLGLSMLGDVCDWDEEHNGIRREGTMVAVMSVTNKFGMIISPAIAGPLLAWSGFDATLGGNQSPDVFLSMRVFYAALPFSCACLAFVLATKLPVMDKHNRKR
jgi:GPH family glycoside/pentoside/hexuronide:cation symporter